MYVWIDALANYLTVAGWTRESDGNWPCDLHTIGKDILKFHGIYWPAFLIAAGIRPFKRILVHGWWTANHEKIGKSLGNAIDPRALADTWGIEALKFFLLREATLANDADISEDAMLHRYNHELADVFGNLILRVLSKSLIPALELPPCAELREADRTLVEAIEALPGTVDHHVQYGRTRFALQAIWETFRDVNKYLSEQEPWKRLKDNQERYGTIIYVACEAIRITVLCLWPFLPRTAESVLKALGASAPLDNDPERIFKFGQLVAGTKITAAQKAWLFEKRAIPPRKIA
jgi:methionyl-tRNA synthetase